MGLMVQSRKPNAVYFVASPIGGKYFLLFLSDNNAGDPSVIYTVYYVSLKWHPT